MNYQISTRKKIKREIISSLQKVDWLILCVLRELDTIKANVNHDNGVQTQENHILHRNLKPDNIFINKKLVKISDFGMSRIETFPLILYTPEDPKERERSNREVKRLWYRAQEIQLILGCILAEMALRSPLFSGKTEIEYLFEVFQFLGSPDESDWSSITIDVNVKINFPYWKKYSLQINELKQMKQQTQQKIDLQKITDSQYNIRQGWSRFIVKIVKYNRNNTSSFLNAVSQNTQIYYTEPKFKEYLEFQTEINQTMQSTLIYWLINVCIHFELMDETLHLSIIYIDLVQSTMKISKKNLQLIGVTSLKIAEYMFHQFYGVYNERSKEYFKQENYDAYAYITADEYKEQQIIDMEQEILSILDYNLTYRTPIQFLKIINSKLKESNESSVLSYYFCDFFLFGQEQLIIERQLYAVCCLLLALNTKNEQINSNQQFQFTVKDILQCKVIYQVITTNQLFRSLHVERQTFKSKRHLIKYSNSEFITQFLR